MAKPKPLSDILINWEKIKIRKIINKLYYGKGRMTFEEAEAQFNELSFSSRDMLMDMLLEDWCKRHPRPKNPKKLQQWEKCYDVLWYNLADDILGMEFNQEIRRGFNPSLCYVRASAPEQTLIPLSKSYTIYRSMTLQTFVADVRAKY